jgi:chromosome segregation ATPase
MNEMEDYDGLKHKYMLLQAELDLANQALYDCKRNMKSIQSIEVEYQEEIKLLQCQADTEKRILETKIHTLEETISNLKTIHDERVGNLEKELITKDEEIKNLKRDMEDIIKIAGARDSAGEEKLMCENSELRQEVLNLSEHVDQLENSLESCEKQNLVLQETSKRLEEELESYKETLECKRKELEEANDLIQSLRDDYFCVQSELDTIKSKPLDDQSQGNSLFAEVNDRRLQLQQNMNIMKTKYLEMKHERVALLQQVTTLRNENISLIARCEAEIDGKKRDEDMIIDTYKSQFQTLNELIESYKKQLNEKSSAESASIPAMKFFDNMLAIKNAEIEGFRQKLATKTVNCTSLSYDLAEANREVRKYNLEIMRLKNEISELNGKMQEMEIANAREKSLTEEVKAPVEEVKVLKSIVKSSKTEDTNVVDLEETDKENDSILEKKVQFCQSTVESHVTDRRKLRKGGKVLVIKPVQYF